MCCFCDGCACPGRTFCVSLGKGERERAGKGRRNREEFVRDSDTCRFLGWTSVILVPACLLVADLCPGEFHTEHEPQMSIFGQKCSKKFGQK